MTLFSDGSTNWVTPSNVELEWADQTSVILEIQPGSPNTTTHSTVILSFISCSSKWSPSNSFSRRNPSANLSSSFQAYLAHLLSLTDAECRKSYYVLRFIPSTLFLHPFFRRNAFSAFRDLIQSISVSPPCLRPYKTDAIIAYTFMFTKCQQSGK